MNRFASSPFIVHRSAFIVPKYPFLYLMRGRLGIAVLVTAALTAAAQPVIAPPPPRSVGAAVAEAERLQPTDSQAAREMLVRALALPRGAGDAGDRAAALLHLCWSTDDPALALKAANDGLAEAARANDGRRQARLLSCRGNAFELAARYDEAMRDYHLAKVGAERAGDRNTVCDALMQSGYLRYAVGDFNAALIDLRRAYDLAGAAGYAQGRRSALSYIAHINADVTVGQYDKAIEYYTQLLSDAEKPSKVNVADDLFNLGSTYERKGDFKAALGYYRRALATEQTLGRKDEAAYVQRSIAITMTKLGRPAEALPIFDQALARFTASGEADRTAQVRQSRGIAYRKLGRIDAAIADLTASGDFFTRTKNDRFREKSLDELAFAYAAAGRWQEAYRAREADADLQKTLAVKLREEHTSRLRVQFDTEKKEEENRALARENALRNRALDAARRIDRLQKIVLILGALVVVFLIYLVAKHIGNERRLRIMALTDDLTRLPNRRRIVAVGDDLLHDAVADDGKPFVAVAFDIDHFKRVNDTYGHAAGDIVLRRIAHACRTAIRPTDHIGRTGGEEFIVLLPGTRLHEAVQVAERLRTAVEAVNLDDIAPGLHITISLGVAEWRPGDSTLAKLLGRADAVLYRAKDSGRNRVELAVA
jgi:diguanylate cyclase (GGDEF)-like protein